MIDAGLKKERGICDLLDAKDGNEDEEAAGEEEDDEGGDEDEPALPLART